MNKGKIWLKRRSKRIGKSIEIYNDILVKVINFNNPFIHMQIEKQEQKPRRNRLVGQSYDPGQSTFFRKSNQSPYLQSIVHLNYRN